MMIPVNRVQQAWPGAMKSLTFRWSMHVSVVVLDTVTLCKEDT